VGFLSPPHNWPFTEVPLLPDLQVRMGALKRSSGAPFLLRAQTFQLEFHLTSTHVLKSQRRERPKVCRPQEASGPVAWRGHRDQGVSSPPTHRAEPEPRERRGTCIGHTSEENQPRSWAHCPLSYMLYPSCFNSSLTSA